MENLREEIVQFSALDGALLTGTLFVPASAPQLLLLIASGTGIPRRFYGRFARHAAGLGFAVLTFDYRGIGDSAPASLRNYKAKYRDWGQLDIPGAIAWLTDQYNGLPLTVVGHSTGGQQLGLAPNVDRIKAAIFVTVSTGYWRGMPTLYKWLTLLLWRTYLPIASFLYGYALAKKIRWGENLPTGVAREWGAWCLEPTYMAAFFDETGHRTSPDGNAFGPVYFDRARFPIRALYFPDDPISTSKNVPPILSLYEKSDVTTLWIKPAEIDVPKIGHLGFFRSGIGKPLWHDALEWLKSQI